MLQIQSDNGTFDLFGSEDIVQTLAIFNFEDITGRSGEYSNMFKMPLTNNNISLIEYADYITSVNTTPYKKISVRLVIDGEVFKTGYLAIDSISDSISGRFYSGNSNFYDLLKSFYLSDLDWSAYDHIWNYTNAVASSANTSGYIYPVMTYGGQTLGGDIVDVRKILPATYNGTILLKILSDLGYTVDLNFDTSDLDVSLLPYSNRNPTISAAVLLLNSVDVKTVANQTLPVLTKQMYQGVYSVVNFYTSTINYTDIATIGSSQYFNFSNNKFTAQYSGNYDIDALVELDNYDFVTYTFSQQLVVYYSLSCNTYLRIVKKSGNVTSVVASELCATNSAGYNSTTPPYKDSITGISTTYITNTLSTTTYLNAGDELYVQLYTIPIVQWEVAGTVPVNLYATFSPEHKLNDTLTVDLHPELSFNQLITYSSIMPRIKCNDYIKDICIRFGLVFQVDEDSKHIVVNKLDTIIDNIPNAINWSDKLDDSESPEIGFKYDSYAQINNFKHKEDKTIINTDDGTNYILNIDNQNLELEKTIYTSPFAATELTTFNGIETANIGLYNTITAKFDIDIQPRICFSEAQTGLFKFTDGTTTSGYINTRRIWFIDNNLPDLSMGFSMSLIPKNSQYLITTLQDLKLVKANFNLSIVDIKGFDFFIPIYIEKFNAYFFVSSINQFNYTRPNLTEVDLIKLNQ